ncbi:MAG: YdcF family protein, partial [Planctomycetes bacterium]|nr:YdcF family protein [Planctomycetota bacterium]
MTHRVFEILLLPPASLVWLFALGLIFTRRWPRLGRTLRIVAFALLWVTATPLCGGLLLGALQTFPALPPEGVPAGPQAIVVLSAEADRDGPEYGGAVAGPMTMQRLRYGAALQRRTGLPLLVSGGIPARDRPALAELMAGAARGEFGVPVRWVEARSADTWQNAE